MELGTVTNTVNVKSDALQVETQSMQNGVVIDGTRFTSTDVRKSNLLQLQPGVSPKTLRQVVLIATSLPNKRQFPDI
jgi:hypothetical protein